MECRTLSPPLSACLPPALEMHLLINHLLLWENYKRLFGHRTVQCDHLPLACHLATWPPALVAV